MLTITRWNDLRQFGIDALTGEACGLSYRILCDVTERGKRAIEKALGVQSLNLPENWNHGTDADPHVGSIMLAPELLPLLATFALLEHGCPEVWLLKSGAVTAPEPDDEPEQVSGAKQWYTQDGSIVRTLAYRGTAGDRNRHQMTGRVV